MQVLVALIALSTCICIVETVIYGDSFLQREIAFHHFKQALSFLDSQPILAFQDLEKSFLTFPNIYTLEYLLQILDLLGQPKIVQDWMRYDDRSREVVSDWQRISDRISHGRSFTSAQQYDEAIAVYDGILQQNPNFVDALFLKGAVLEKLGHLQQSAQQFEEVIRLFPIHTRSILSLGTLHQRYGDYRECFGLYERALSIYQLYHKTAKEVNPHVSILHDDYLKVQGNLILAYFQQGNYLQVSRYLFYISFYSL